MNTTLRDTPVSDRVADLADGGTVSLDFRDFLSSQSFSSPQYLPNSAWIEHAPFALWLIHAVNPRRLVELGAHTGFSYFTFCQAIQAAGLDTTCYAIDTWQGDEHAGMYDESIFEAVNTHNNRHYGTFSRLVRSTFDEALPHFEDGSIDLLHVDGRHFYEDVKYDFESWIPKLSTRAIVLFHDTNVRERNFGVFKYWAELAERYPHFEFFHGHGLGVLGYGKDLPPQLRALFAAGSQQPTAVAIRQAYSALGSAVRAQGEAKLERDRFAASDAATRAHSARLEADLATLRQEYGQLAGLIAAKDEQLAQTSQQLARHSDDSERLSRELAACWSRIADLEKETANLRTTNQGLRVHIEWLEGHNASLGSQLQLRSQEQAEAAQLTQELYDSLSWRLTKPLRFAKHRLLRAARQSGGAPEPSPSGTDAPLPGLENLSASDIARIKTKFDEAFYKAQYPDIAASGSDPFTHYMVAGWREGRDPAPNFSTTQYLQATPEIQARALNPLVHWVLSGAADQQPAAQASGPTGS